MEITFLGTGTSQGVPIIGCTCEVCLSVNKKDKRLRSSIFIEVDDVKIVIDTGPDFRQQMLVNQITNVDAILFTHEHKDHIAGLDDIRPINFLHKKDMPLYAESRVGDALRREFHYAFAEKKYPGVPNLILNEIENQPFNVQGLEVLPIRVMHHKLPIFGFRIQDFAYVTDANFISDQEMEKLKNLDVLVLNALRHEKHISHFTLLEALDVVQKVKPKKAYFTHISHLLGFHEDVVTMLPKNVTLAYDSLKISL